MEFAASCVFLLLLVLSTNHQKVLSLRPTATTATRRETGFRREPTAEPFTTISSSSSSSSDSTRRQWLIGAVATTTAAVSFVDPSNAEPSRISKLQSPVQDAIAPGHWIGRYAGLNSKEETWEFPKNTPEEVSKALVDVLEGLSDERKSKLYMPEFDIRKADASKVHVLAWTKLEWLDTLDVTLETSSSNNNNNNSNNNNNRNNNGCVATATFYATGFLPTNIPGAPILNVAMAWFPFASPGPRGEMLQDFRLRALKGMVTNKLKEHTVTPDLYV